MGPQVPTGRRRAAAAQGAAGPADGAETKRCPQCGTLYPLAYKVCPRDRTPLELPAGAEDDPLIGEVLANAFCIVGVIGEGGMGRVYEAEHVRLPRRYAVKVIAPQFARHQEAVGRFEREAQAAARVIHPNVLDVVDVVRAEDGRPCIVAELLEGEELGDILDRDKRLPVAEAVDVCRQVCRGLAAAHAQGIVHRDLKPANLFLCRHADGSRVVKILDFGVAKMTDGAALTRAGTIVGTPAYMAPEQARGLAIDGRADVYALGAVLYHLLTGRPPFDQDEPASILLAVVTEPPPKMRAIDPSLPPALESIVEQAMTKEPTDRFASAAAFEAALADFALETQRPSRMSAEPAQGAHSATLVDPIPARVGTLPSPDPAVRTPPSVMIVVVSAALVGVAILGALGAILTLVSSKKDLGESTGILVAIFVVIMGVAGAAFAANLKRAG